MTDEKDSNISAEADAAEENIASQPEVAGNGPDEGGGGEPQMPDEMSSDAADDSPEDAPEGEPAEGDFKTVNESDASEDDAEAAMMAMLEDLPEEASKPEVDDLNFAEASVSQAEFQQLSQPASQAETRNIDLLMDVNLPVSIELGRTKMSISDILGLGPGSVVELNKLAGEPVDLLVNQKIVAKGEVVVVDENFGVRITQLMTPEERLKSLGEDT